MSLSNIPRINETTIAYQQPQSPSYTLYIVPRGAGGAGRAGAGEPGRAHPAQGAGRRAQAWRRGPPRAHAAREEEHQAQGQGKIRDTSMT